MPVSKIQFNNIAISSDKGFTATDASGIDLNSVKIIPQKDPVYLLNNVKNFNIKEGYFPTTATVFIKGDSTTSGVHITSTDLRNDKGALQLAEKNN
jgi:hypothetical protein